MYVRNISSNKNEKVGKHCTSAESKNEDSIRTDEGRGDVYRYNSLLNPVLDVYDLDTGQINPEICDNKKFR